MILFYCVVISEKFNLIQQLKGFAELWFQPILIEYTGNILFEGILTI